MGKAPRGGSGPQDPLLDMCPILSSLAKKIQVQLWLSELIFWVDCLIKSKEPNTSQSAYSGKQQDTEQMWKNSKTFPRFLKL